MKCGYLNLIIINGSCRYSNSPASPCDVTLGVPCDPCDVSRVTLTTENQILIPFIRLILNLKWILSDRHLVMTPLRSSTVNSHIASTVSLHWRYNKIILYSHVVIMVTHGESLKNHHELCILTNHQIMYQWNHMVILT